MVIQVYMSKLDDESDVVMAVMDGLGFIIHMTKWFAKSAGLLCFFFCVCTFLCALRGSKILKSLRVLRGETGHWQYMHCPGFSPSTSLLKVLTLLTNCNV